MISNCTRLKEPTSPILPLSVLTLLWQQASVTKVGPYMTSVDSTAAEYEVHPGKAAAGIRLGYIYMSSGCWMVAHYA